MTVKQIKSTVHTFARSQGFYGRLARDLDESKGWGELARAATKAGCTDDLSFILWLEGA